MKRLNYLLGALLIFGILTWISYHDGMAYDGETSLGFPLKFYKEGVGQNLDTGEMGHFTNHSFFALITDLACSFLIYLIILFLFKILIRKSLDGNR